MSSFFITFAPFLAIISGSAIGFFFGTVQNLALNRNKKLQESGKLKNGWTVMPGSMGRVAILLITLAIIQFAFPIIFTGNIKWLVSAGVLLGYGWTFVKELKQRSLGIHS